LNGLQPDNNGNPVPSGITGLNSPGYPQTLTIQAESAGRLRLHGRTVTIRGLVVRTGRRFRLEFQIRNLV
jgi:hypothetical protein